MKAFGLCISFRHVLALLGLAIPLVGAAMVSLAAGIDPYHAGATTGSGSSSWCELGFG